MRSEEDARDMQNNKMQNQLYPLHIIITTQYSYSIWMSANSLLAHVNRTLSEFMFHGEIPMKYMRGPVEEVLSQ